jgi:hypothetical protein
MAGKPTNARGVSGPTNHTNHTNAEGRMADGWGWGEPLPRAPEFNADGDSFHQFLPPSFVWIGVIRGQLSVWWAHELHESTRMPNDGMGKVGIVIGVGVNCCPWFQSAAPTPIRSINPSRLHSCGLV